jgi:hypothetical protein
VATLEKKELKMLQFPGTQRTRHRKSIFAASSLLLLLSTPCVAQSGRKAAAKPSPSPSSIPTVNDENSSTRTGARDLNHKVSLLVARQPTSKHLMSEDAIFTSFLNHLNEVKNVSATSLGDLKRDEVVKRAKIETEAIVVLVRFDVDSFQKGTIILNSPDLDVDVSVFVPTSGHEKFKGKVYYKAMGGPNVKKDNWPAGTPIKITTEAVGVEAAEQVRDWLILEDVKKKN